MGFPIVPIVGAAASAVADMITGSSNAKAARKAFNNRYQNTVIDMKKAGLNPALAYGQGGGNPQTHDLPLPGEQATKAAQQLGTARQAAATTRNIEAATAKTIAETDLLRQQMPDLALQPGLVNAEILSRAEQAGAAAGLSLRQQEVANETITSLQLDNNYKEATLQQRVAMIAQDMESKGLTISKQRIENYLLELAKPAKETSSRVFTHARDFLRASEEGVRNFGKNFKATFE